jgi:hypothetical protein
MQSLGVKAEGKGLGDEGQCIRDREGGDWGGRIAQVIVIRARVHGLRLLWLIIWDQRLPKMAHLGVRALHPFENRQYDCTVAKNSQPLERFQRRFALIPAFPETLDRYRYASRITPHCAVP